MNKIGSVWLLMVAVAGAQSRDIVWTDATKLTVEGRGWTDTGSPWARLPSRAQTLVRKPVWDLSRQSAGICVKFVTDAVRIDVHWTLTSGRLALPHMPATGVSGVDLYLKTASGWRWAATPRPSKTDMRARLVQGLSASERTWALYLPLYNGVKTLEIGVPRGSSLRPLAPSPDRDRRPIVFYGTSITQGGCASRPGMCHPAIVGRRLDRPVINLGFSGNGKMEPELAELIGELDASVFVLDCLPNMNGKLVSERVVPFVLRLRSARPKTPILLVEDRTYQDSHVSGARARGNRANRAALRAAHAALEKRGVKALAYLEGKDLLGQDGDGTVDGSHPSDLGFSRQADLLEPAIRRLLVN